MRFNRGNDFLDEVVDAIRGVGKSDHWNDQVTVCHFNVNVRS